MTARLDHDDLNDDLIRAIIHLMRDDHDAACAAICDLLTAQRLISIPDDLDQYLADQLDINLTDLAIMRDRPDSFDLIMHLARDAFDDATESTHAAHIRDTMRDNPTDHES